MFYQVYKNVIWGYASIGHINKVQRLQNRAVSGNCDRAALGIEINDAGNST